MIHKPLPRREVSSAADLDDFSFDPECEIGVFAQCSKPAKVLSDDFTPSRLISTDDLGFSTQLEMTTDEQRIRDYCMLMKQQQGSEASDVARDLAKNTQYDIHPNATILPLMTQNKSESKETRKALLQTLSPLLTQAENARKTDHEIIEGHTRCTIERVNNKSCAYKYTDIDNGNHVAPSEYEKRYLMHLSMLKTGHKLSPVTSSNTDLNLTQSQIDKKNHLANFIVKSNSNSNITASANKCYAYSYNDVNIPHQIIRTLSENNVVNDENRPPNSLLLSSQSLSKQSLLPSTSIPRPRSTLSSLMPTNIDGKIVRKPFTPHNSSSTLPSYSCLAIVDPESFISPTSYPLASTNQIKNENGMACNKAVERVIFTSVSTENNGKIENPMKEKFLMKSMESAKRISVGKKTKVVTSSPPKEIVTSSPSEKVVTSSPSEKVVMSSPSEKVVMSSPSEKVVTSSPTRFSLPCPRAQSNLDDENNGSFKFNEGTNTEMNKNMPITPPTSITTKNLIVVCENPKIDTFARTFNTTNVVLSSEDDEDLGSDSVTHSDKKSSKPKSFSSSSKKFTTKVTTALLNFGWSAMSNQATRVGRFLSTGKKTVGDKKN